MRIAAIALMAMALWVHGAVAEIYTWTDEDGNVHFGDQPPESESTGKAEAVQLQQGYQPEERSAEETQALQREQVSAQEARRRREQADAAQREEERREQDERKREYCAALAGDINKFGNARMENGRLVIHYLEGEDGRSISAEEQRRVVDELRAKWQAQGCDKAS